MKIYLCYFQSAKIMSKICLKETKSLEQIFVNNITWENLH